MFRLYPGTNSIVIFPDWPPFDHIDPPAHLEVYVMTLGALRGMGLMDHPLDEKKNRCATGARLTGDWTPLAVTTTPNQGSTFHPQSW